MNSLQKCILDIYKGIKAICEKHDIPYYAIGGTAIGAVRHKGFIPWDDDLDIAIPIECYWEFFKIASVELPSYYSIKHCISDKYYVFPFAKIIDERTTFIEKWEDGFSGLYKGVFVDIMPIAGIPRNYNERKLFFTRIDMLILLNRWRRIPVKCSENRKNFIAKCIIKPLLLLFPPDYYFNKYMELLEGYPLYNSDSTGYTWGRYGGKNIVFPSGLFKATVDIPFEDTAMKCPVGYDEMLRIQFGNYMLLPPEKDRIPRHKPFVDLNISYHQYIQDRSTPT